MCQDDPIPQPDHRAALSAFLAREVEARRAEAPGDPIPMWEIIEMTLAQTEDGEEPRGLVEFTDATGLKHCKVLGRVGEWAWRVRKVFPST